MSTLRDFKGLHVEFDNYGSTNSDETRKYAEDIYRKLDKAKLIAKRSIEQFYDPVKNMFLPDRFIKGECPKCGAKDQYGDNCEVCGAAYAPTELKNPYSAVSGAKPELRNSDHYFFRLSAETCQKFLREWTRSGSLQPEAANKMQEWLGAEGEHKLTDWDISRDAPYFGFEIPDAPGKYFYVWLDAPVGYMGSFQQLCNDKGLDFGEYWKAGSKTELYHFIGKDILYFHALFWPAMLQHAGFRTPTKLFAHGFLTVNGEKMSKSRGTFITASSYVEHVKNTEYLRYYYAAKLNGTMEDIDLNLDDFVAKVNSDLIGKYINIASRTAGILHKHFSGKIGKLELGGDASTGKPVYDIIIQDMQNVAPRIREFYENRRFALAVRETMKLADEINKWLDKYKPWELSKKILVDANHDDKSALHGICSTALESFRLLTLLLKPVLPKVAESTEKFLNIASLTWNQVNSPLPLGHQIKEYKHLMTRFDPKLIESMVAANRNPSPLPPLPQAGEGRQRSPNNAMPHTNSTPRTRKSRRQKKISSRSSASRTSPRSTCASRRSSTRSMSKARRNY